MWGFLRPRTKPATIPRAAWTGLPSGAETCCTDVEGDPTPPGEAAPRGHEIFTGYQSDQSESDGEDDTDDEDEPDDADDEDEPDNTSGSRPQSEELANDTTPGRAETPISIPLISGSGMMERKRRCAAAEVSTPPLKRRKRDVLIRIQRNGRKNKVEWIRYEAMTALEKRINSNKSGFEGGVGGLQARRARAIHSYLHMLVRNDRRKTEASERAAEAQGFAVRWGGRQVRSWAKLWIKHRKLPESRRGKHIKLFTLLEDPNICAELRSYVRSNKWAIDPAKLADFSAKKMVPKAAEAYGTNLMKKEIPIGLKRYLELELFPRIHMKVARGVSLSTARRWLHRQGFRFTEHRKALYFDGHERPDVVEYRQNNFIPQLKEYRQRLVEYVVGGVAKEKEKLVENYVERRLVLVSHDESTTQANDGKKMSWVHEKEHALKKKGAGRGIHQSDVICSTVGWLKAASQSLEYGKNYEGYWNGELFVKQVRHNYKM